MKQNLFDLKFHLNKTMADYILQVKNIKRQLVDLDETNEEYQKLMTEFETIKKAFINEFQKNNRKEIEKYLEIKKNS